MSLVAAVRKDTNTIWITGTVRPANAKEGVRIRRRAGSDSLKLAREEARTLEAEILRNAWYGERRGTRGFSAAAISYISHEDRSTGTQKLVDRLIAHFGETPLSAITQEAVDEARKVVLRAGAEPATVKRNLIVPLRAVLIHAAKRGWCDVPQFDIPTESKGRTVFLLPAEVEALIAASAPHLQPLLRFLVCTGCRMSEALRLDWRDVDLNAARAILWEGETKGGGRRVVSLPPRVVEALAGLPRRAGVVFLDHKGLAYRDSSEYGGQIKTAWATACRKAQLSDVGPHHLRHTWASWHYATHRDLLLLKNEGGWASTALVERYAHIMPSGFDDEINSVWGISA
jgi:integrase